MDDERTMTNIRNLKEKKNNQLRIGIAALSMELVPSRCAYDEFIFEQATYNPLAFNIAASSQA